MPYKCRRAYNKAYREANKEKMKAYNKTYRKANKEKIKAYRNAYNKANKEKVKVWNAIYYEANKEKVKASHVAYREANIIKLKAYDKAYYEANKDKSAAKVARRKSLKLKLIPTHLLDCPIEKNRISNTYKLRDVFTKITGVQHHVDHMWPLSDGGPHWSGNLQIITATENSRKHAKVDPNIKSTIQDMLIEEEQMRYEQH